MAQVGRVTRAEMVASKALAWADQRFKLAKGLRKLADKLFPDHWSFMLGEIALYSFVILVATGVFLTLYFEPSAAEVTYQGPYPPLVGQRVSVAYASTVNLSFVVRFGLLMRQMHHWAADIFVGAIAVHMARVFLTGAFRRPRELNWIIGVTLLMLSIANGFLGYSLPDDLISGTGIRIMFSIVESIPLVGTYLAFWLFGGNYPGNGVIIPRMFVLHVLILPAVIAALIGAHLGLLFYQKHTQFPGRGRTERNVVGGPFWPNFVFKTTGFLFMVAAVIAGLGAFAQINPIWQYGPYVPYRVAYAVQPDWYMGWLDGALRIMPSWEFQSFGVMIPNQFFPAVLLPGICFAIFYLWPFLEAWYTKDRAEHNLLDRPRFRPKRTAVGVGGLTFFFMLFFASSTDVMANYLQISLNLVLWFFRIFTYIMPVVTGVIAYVICKELQHAGEMAGKRRRYAIILRTPEGEYVSTYAQARPGDKDVFQPEPEPVPLTPEVERLMAENADVLSVPPPEESPAIRKAMEETLPESEGGEKGVKVVERD
jgi:ubiquinol-cytochrome c reductase cytochrome b subunit